MSDMTIQTQPARAATQIPAEKSLPQTSAGKLAKPAAVVESQGKKENSASEQVVRAKAATVNASTIMTYRDNDSGRLVVKLMDKDNNSVITEFPSPSMLSHYPKVVPPAVPSTTVDTEV